MANPAIYEIDPDRGTAVIGLSDGRTVTVTFSACLDDRGYDVQLDGSECIEIVDESEPHPDHAAPLPGWDGCVSVPALLSEQERDLVESLIAAHLHEEAERCR